MQIQFAILTIVVFLWPLTGQTAMDKGYYENARDVCQLHAQMKAGKPLPIDKTLASIAKVTPINKGKKLKVTAWDEIEGKKIECNCILGPGDADLYPSVRLAETPKCSVK